jgi:NADH-quinone oxidoreductase subunit H
MIWLILILHSLLNSLLIALPVLLSVAFITLAERKVMGAAQRRLGPNVVGFFGILQPLADGVKLIFKETVLPIAANKFTFALAPVLTFFLSLITWAVIPFDFGVVLADLNLGILYLFAISSLGVYGIIISGWASNSRYAFLGALRSTAQMVSYEVSIGLIIMSIFVCVGSLNLTHVVLFQQNIWFFIPFYPLFILFFVSALVETNRPPFDLPEAESELVSGYNVEYSAAGFALFFIGEYANLILMGSLISVLFFGGWLPLPGFHWLPISGPLWLGLKTAFFVFCFVWVRVAFPRYRYDQLMRLGWKVFLPLSLGFLVLVSCIVFSI